MAIVKNCKNIEPYFAPFVDGLLEEEEAQLVQEHVEACPDCLARLAMSRQARLLLLRLQEEGIVLPEGFQARLMQRIMTGDLATDILDLSWQGLATTLLQLLEAIFGMLLGPQPATAWQPA